ncbi:MAG: SDR family oxidoreductase [Alphaproteobacteria bacterium]|jgi:2-keto-3-deoxy-L-fuconate dehydrogenase|nr:SDR family oxidoreductase [Alphaproteobacteria bacterium]
MSLAGKTALITAAGQGIGRATAEAFLAAGAKLWATDIDEEKLAGLDGAETFALDVTDVRSVSAARERTGPVDILFNCAGYVAVGNLLECDDDDWERSFRINVDSMRRTIAAYLPGMIDGGYGRIVNMASVASSVSGVKSRAAYGVTKAAVIGLTKSVAMDYIEHGITCNAVCPGTVETPSLGERIQAFDDPVAARRMFIDRQPMGRLAQPQEIAGLVTYLASESAAFMTGQAVVVDGGISL